MKRLDVEQRQLELFLAGDASSEQLRHQNRNSGALSSAGMAGVHGHSAGGTWKSDNLMVPPMMRPVTCTTSPPLLPITVEDGNPAAARETDRCT